MYSILQWKSFVVSFFEVFDTWHTVASDAASLSCCLLRSCSASSLVSIKVERSWIRLRISWFTQTVKDIPVLYPKKGWNAVPWVVMHSANLNLRIQRRNYNLTTYWDQASGPVLLDTSEDLSRSNNTQIQYKHSHTRLVRVGTAHSFGLQAL